LRLVFGLTTESLTIIDIVHYNYLMPEEQQYQRVASKNELQEGGLLKVQVKDKALGNYTFLLPITNVHC
jgi:hypothetical protein